MPSCRSAPLELVLGVRHPVRVTVVLLMLIAMYAAGFLVFLSIAALAARACHRRLFVPRD